jgi:3-oxoacyl-[acyl-carrier protein] reductase
LSSLKNKSVLITGAGRGIGKRLALGFARAGARVGLLSRTQAELDLAKLEIEQAGGNALRIRADVRDLEQLMASVDRIRVVFGALDVLVCSAGVQGPIGPFLSAKPRAWAEAIDVNLIGVANACRAALPGMIERRSGKIIVVAGPGSASARPNFSAYAASQAALVRFVECIAAEVRDDNVQVNAMAPGGSYTHMTDEVLHARGERYSRLNDKNGVALSHAVLFLVVYLATAWLLPSGWPAVALPVSPSPIPAFWSRAGSPSGPPQRERFCSIPE